MLFSVSVNFGVDGEVGLRDGGCEGKVVQFRLPSAAAMTAGIVDEDDIGDGDFERLVRLPEMSAPSSSTPFPEKEHLFGDGRFKGMNASLWLL